MTDISPNVEPILASASDTVFVVSPHVQLVDDVRNYCASRNLKLWEGNPDSPDVIAVPYKIGIVDKHFMDPKSWSDWMEFLRETRGMSHEHLLIIVLPAPYSDYALDEARKEFEDALEPVSFVFGSDESLVIQIMKNWLDTGSTGQPGVCRDAASFIVSNNPYRPRHVTFRERLEELMSRVTVEETKHKVSVDVYFKYRIQAKWLLIKFLGGNHPYTKELDMMFAVDMDPFGVGAYLLAAKGILEALAEDLDNGLVQVKEGA
jgi:hypothetical protein